MERPRHLITSEKFWIIIITIIYMVGLAGHILPQTRDFMVALTPLNLVFTNLLAIVFLSRRNPRRRLLIVLIIAYIFTFLCEAIGVATGLIFGEYAYSQVLGFHIAQVPLIIGLNWIVVVIGAFAFARQMFRSKILQIISTAVVTVIFDIFLEPVAIKLNYWQWAEVDPPLQNYLAWFIISLIIATLLTVWHIQVNSKILKVIFVLQLGFFLILNLFLS